MTTHSRLAKNNKNSINTIHTITRLNNSKKYSNVAVHLGKEAIGLAACLFALPQGSW